MDGAGQQAPAQITINHELPHRFQGERGPSHDSKALAG